MTFTKKKVVRIIPVFRIRNNALGKTNLPCCTLKAIQYKFTKSSIIKNVVCRTLHIYVNDLQYYFLTFLSLSYTKYGTAM